MDGCANSREHLTNEKRVRDLFFEGESSLPSLPTRLGLSTRREQDIEDFNNRKDVATQMEMAEPKPSVSTVKSEESPRDMSVAKTRLEVSTDVEMQDVSAAAESATSGEYWRDRK